MIKQDIYWLYRMENKEENETLRACTLAQNCNYVRRMKKKEDMRRENERVIKRG